MQFLPISINITDKKILIIGGGRIGLHKLLLLKRFTSNITVLAKEVTEEIRSEGVKIIENEYDKSYLDGFFLIYACVNDKNFNKKIKNDAKSKGILVNVADNPILCDFISPAIYKFDYMTISVSSGAKNVNKSVQIRDEIKKFLENG